jgi:8-oxo-dGTP diphosphatase
VRVLQVVAAVIEREDGTVLAGRRASGRASAGLWEFPGGKVERGEDPTAALEREILEELGTTVVCGALVDRSTTEVETISVDLACFRVTVVGPLPTASSDHDELRWVAPERLDALDWTKPDLPAVTVLVNATRRDASPR